MQPGLASRHRQVLGLPRSRAAQLAPPVGGDRPRARRELTPMRWRYQLPLRLRSLLQGERVDRELRDELRFHLERQIDENLAAGMSPEEARLAARRTLAGIGRIEQPCPPTPQPPLLQTLLHDPPNALRALARNPGATTV